MSQTTMEPEEDPRKRAAMQSRDAELIAEQRQEEAYIQSRGYKQVFSEEMKAYFLLVTVLDLLLLASVTAAGAAWLFVPVFLGVVLTYIAGALYSFKKLMTY